MAKKIRSYNQSADFDAFETYNGWRYRDQRAGTQLYIDSKFPKSPPPPMTFRQIDPSVYESPARVKRYAQDRQALSDSLDYLQKSKTADLSPLLRASDSLGQLVPAASGGNLAKTTSGDLLDKNGNVLDRVKYRVKGSTALSRVISKRTVTRSIRILDRFSGILDNLQIAKLGFTALRNIWNGRQWSKEIICRSDFERITSGYGFPSCGNYWIGSAEWDGQPQIRLYSWANVQPSELGNGLGFTADAAQSWLFTNPVQEIWRPPFIDVVIPYSIPGAARSPIPRFRLPKNIRQNLLKTGLNGLNSDWPQSYQSSNGDKPPLRQAQNPDPYQGLSFSWGGGAKPPISRSPMIGRKPPSPGTKEKKGSGNKIAAVNKALFAAIEGLTEFNDLVDAIYDALPKKYQTADNFAQKPIVIYNNFEHLDIHAAIGNIIYNHIEDAVIGRMDATAKKQFGSFNNLTGSLGTDTPVGDALGAVAGKTKGAFQAAWGASKGIL